MNTLAPANDYSAQELAELFTGCFAGYFVPLHVDATAIGNMVRRDSVSLDRSVVIERAGEPVGFMLLAVRGKGARIAAMGVKPEARRNGLARQLVSHAIREGKSAGCENLALEVITANTAAVRLYEAAGFERICTLRGFTLAAPTESAVAAAAPNFNETQFTATNSAEVADCIARHGSANLPWQLSADTICNALPGHTALKWNDRGVCLITDPSQSRVALLSLVIDRDVRRRGFGRAMLCDLCRALPGRTWRVPELVPDGEGSAFLNAVGWAESSLQQYLMSRQI